MIKNIWSHTGARFAIIGVFNTLFDFAILNLLVFAFGLNNIVANTISVTLAMAVSYVLNYHVVFRQKTANHAKRVLLFLLVTAFGLWILQNGVIYIFVHWFTWPASVAKSTFDLVGLHSFTKDFAILNTAKVFGTVVSLLWNFFMYKRLVFTDNVKTVDSKQ
jgi:putative flippase GtrA